MARSLWRGATRDKKGCRHRSEFVCDQARDVPPKAAAQAIAESRLPFDRRTLAPPRLHDRSCQAGRIREAQLVAARHPNPAEWPELLRQRRSGIAVRQRGILDTA